MRLPAVLAAVAVTAVTASLATPATAAPIEHGRVHDVETDVFTCESNGLPIRQDTDVVTTFMFNLRGSSPFPYLKENVHGTTTWTNLLNGGTFTNVFSSNYHDVKTTDNGDGTYTLDVYAQGGSRFYDNAGNFVMNDPGGIRFRIVIDYGGTPADPYDDNTVSFEVLRESTGRTDTIGHDFCEDVRIFSAA